MALNVLDTIQNRIGAFASAPAAPPAGAGSVVLAARMSAAEAADPSDTLALELQADLGAGWETVAALPPWTGGPGRAAPSLAWAWHSAEAPRRVRGVLENITQVVAGLDLTFGPPPATDPLPIHWYNARDSRMAFEAWMQQQDRTGLNLSPVFAVPAGATGVQAQLTPLVGFTDPAQTVDFQFQASFDGGANYETYGSARWYGSAEVLDKNGNPVPDEFDIGFTPTRTPDHMRVQLIVSGTLNCGVQVQFAGV